MKLKQRTQLLDRLLSDAKLTTLSEGFRWAEGPVWLPERQCLVFSDVSGNRMHRWSSGQIDTFRDPSNFANGNALDTSGRLVTCEHGTRRLSRTEHDGTIVSLAERFEGRRLNSPNDVAVRSDGTIYFTDPTDGLSPQWGIPGERELDFQGLFRVSPVGELIVEATDFSTPNGLAFSPDERVLYVIDTDAIHVRTFNVLPDGALVGGDVCVRMDGAAGPGWSDGMTVDKAGNLWISGPGGIHVFGSTGENIGIVELPECVTNLTWGGDDYRTLFITTAAEDFSASCLYSLGSVTTGGLSSLRSARGSEE